MCNNVLWIEKLKPEPIPETGVGWKVLAKTATEFHAAFNCNGYQREIDGWIHWWNQETGKGFCFFLDQQEAERLCQKDWGRTWEVKKIEYQGGLQKRLQYGIMEDHDCYTMGLCRSFRIIED